MTSILRRPNFPASANLDRWVFRFAGSFILVSLLLAYVHSSNWLWFTAFVGANMLQASFTGLCPLASVLMKLGIQPGAAFACQDRQSASGKC